MTNVSHPRENGVLALLTYFCGRHFDCLTDPAAKIGQQG
jgi:hypothetical protein